MGLGRARLCIVVVLHVYVRDVCWEEKVYLRCVVDRLESGGAIDAQS